MTCNMYASSNKAYVSHTLMCLGECQFVHKEKRYRNDVLY